jgi:hypothetical protein
LAIDRPAPIRARNCFGSNLAEAARMAGSFGFGLRAAPDTDRGRFTGWPDGTNRFTLMLGPYVRRNACRFACAAPTAMRAMAK